MPPIEAPNWWADVQQDRDDLGGRRQPESWLDEEIDFTPRRRFPRRELVLETGALDESLHGTIVVAEAAPVVARRPQAPGAPRARRPARPALPTAVVEPPQDDAPGTWRTWGSVEEPPAPGVRRTVHITGRPEPVPLPGTRARRQRSAVERAALRPDRIVLWAVVLGAILILLAITSNDSQAATHAAALLAR